MCKKNSSLRIKLSGNNTLSETRKKFPFLLIYIIFIAYICESAQKVSYT